MKFFALMLLILVGGCNSAARLECIRAVSLVLMFDNGVCSGTAVARDVILSAEHCFSDKSTLKTINGRAVKVLHIMREPKTAEFPDGCDHVLVRVSIQFETWAKIGDAPKQAERVRWIGNPRGLPNMYREGYVVRSDENGVLIDAPVYNGDSGSGLFNDKGELVAVLSGAMVYGSPLGGMTMQLTACLPLAFTAEQWESIKKPLPVVEVPAPIEAHAG